MAKLGKRYRLNTRVLRTWKQADTAHELSSQY